MTCKERTLAALSFQPTDRTPIAGGMIQSAEYLAHRAGVEDFWADPRTTCFAAFREMGADAILGPVMPKRPEEVTTDAQGRPTDFRRVETKPELVTPEAVADWARGLPAPDQVREEFDFEGLLVEHAATMRDGQAAAGDMLFIPHRLGYAPHFPTSDGYYSYEAFLMACLLYPDDMACAFRNWGEQSRLRFEAVAQVTLEQDLPRIFWIGQDLCDANGPMLSPALFDRLYMPVLAYAIEPLKQARMKVVWHSDANYRLLTPYLVRAGIDGFQGLYETEAGTRLQDLARLRMASGNPPIIYGSISTVWVLPHRSPDDVRREVERCIEAVGPQGGLLLAPSSSIGPEVPWENIDAMYDHAQTYIPSWRR